MGRSLVRPITLGLAAAIVAAACFSDDVEPTSVLPGDCRALADAAGVAASAVVIGIVDFAFVPAEVTVAPGTEVTWVNCEPQGTAGGSHTSTADLGSWDSPLLTRGQIYQRTFAAVGDNPYHCVPHPFMQAVVRVE